MTAQPQDPASIAKLGRAVRPFATRKLLKLVGKFQQRAGDIGVLLGDLMDAEPQGVIAWKQGLVTIANAMEDLSELADEVREEADEMFGAAGQQYEQAVGAVLAAMRGLQAEAERGV